ncbi:hypothetical protein KOEU_27170 [Komagataeibacter europaeus]|uniref:Uncharacterized protein n=1 Tax=Komagataeibacter europaeus TaxID=33995 RepID=A0A0M0EEZ2_KOMEU|nr:hypothetical protein [Komagataeibacter europaeus]KON63810.1 hypothetical protein KOEU_27170 [Komagataeibacter europaeus]
MAEISRIIARLPRNGRSGMPGRLAMIVGRIVGHARAGRRNMAFAPRPGGRGAKAAPVPMMPPVSMAMPMSMPVSMPVSMHASMPASVSVPGWPVRAPAGHGPPTSAPHGGNRGGYTVFPSMPRGDGQGSSAPPAMTRPAIPPSRPVPGPVRGTQRAAPCLPARAAAMPWAGRVASRAMPAGAAIPASWNRTAATAVAVTPRGRTASPAVASIMPRGHIAFPVAMSAAASRGRIASPVATPVAPRDHTPATPAPHRARDEGKTAAPAMPSGRAMPVPIPPWRHQRTGGARAGMAFPAIRAMAGTGDHATTGPAMPRSVPMPMPRAPLRGMTPFPAFVPPHDRAWGRPPFISPGPIERTAASAPSRRDGGRGDRLPVMQVTIPVTLDHQAVGQAMARIDTAAARHELRATGTAPDVIRYPQMPGRAVGV